MKKQILNLGKALNKEEQKSICGGVNCGPVMCFGVPFPGCGTCEDYHALPTECKSRVLVHSDCETGDPT